MEPDHLKILGRLGPFSALSESDLLLIAERGSFVNHPVGTLLFKRSTDDEFSHYLLKGKLTLVDSEFENKAFTDADCADYGAVDDFQPHRVSAVCETNCLVFSFAKIVRDSIEDLLEGAAASADGIYGESSWMERLLKTPLFEFVPPSNIEALFKRFRSHRMIAGDVIIKQGDPGDYFYVIKSGNVRVEVELGGKVSEVASLSAGQTFGQDSLISDLPRNASVVANKSGELVSIEKEDFRALLLSPVIESVQSENLQSLSKSSKAGVQIIDISPSRDGGGQDHTILNIPYLSLRTYLTELSSDVIYVVKGPNSGKIKELAAFLMNENGYTAYVLAQ